jgi:hypothetical protein
LRRAILIIAVVLLLLAGCIPTVIRSEREVILIRYHHDEKDQAIPTILADDDPLYDAFQEHVWSDFMARRLVLLVENTTAAFIATERPSSHPQTLANKPFLALDSRQVGLLRDVQANYTGQRVSVELAMGLGREGQIDLERAALRVPRATGAMLLALAEVPVATDAVAGIETTLDASTTPLLALHNGFIVALEALYVHAQTELMPNLEANANPSNTEDPEAHELWLRYHQVADNTFAMGPKGPLTAEQAYATPGVVATFFFRLFNEANFYYPQRHLLWFANYDAEDTVYAKVLLAMHHMSGTQHASVERFIQSYSEVFPAEREMIQRLAGEVFGAE